MVWVSICRIFIPILWVWPPWRFRWGSPTKKWMFSFRLLLLGGGPHPNYTVHEWPGWFFMGFHVGFPPASLVGWCVLLKSLSPPNLIGFIYNYENGIFYPWNNNIPGYHSTKFPEACVNTIPWEPTFLSFLEVISPVLGIKISTFIFQGHSGSKGIDYIARHWREWGLYREIIATSRDLTWKGS